MKLQTKRIKRRINTKFRIVVTSGDGKARVGSEFTCVQRMKNKKKI